MPVLDDDQWTWRYGIDMSMKYNLDVTHINPEIERIIQRYTLGNTQVILDFDSTITTGDSESSWWLLKTIGSLPPLYHIDAKTLYDAYQPYENDGSLTDTERDRLMREWWKKHLALFREYWFREQQIQEICTNGIRIRHGIIEALRTLQELSIPVLILSAWVHQSIEKALKDKGALFPNIHIATNRVLFHANGNYKGNSPIVPIHVWNKDEWHIPEEVRKCFKWRTNIILMGDHLLDARMAPSNAENVVKIGILNQKWWTIDPEKEAKFHANFDIVVKSTHSDGLVLDYLARNISS